MVVLQLLETLQIVWIAQHNATLSSQKKRFYPKKYLLDKLSDETPKCHILLYHSMQHKKKYELILTPAEGEEMSVQISL